MFNPNMSLSDFVDVEGLGIFEKAEYFKKFVEYLKNNKEHYWGRVAIEASKPLRKVLDVYSGQIREMIYLASNDYLNLSMHPKVVEAGKEALKKYGAGAGSVPLLGGTTDLHVKLEERVSHFKSCKSSLLYTSGFGSNAGTVMALLNKKDVAILDTLVHASIVEGCHNTNIKLFLHNNMRSLERVLKVTKDKYKTRLVIVDGVYSMDGDICHLDQIVTKAKEYGALVMIDDAHATGVIGKKGKGTAEYFGLEGKIDIVAGTFSKAVGVVGGFISSNEALIEYLRYFSRSYIFSTALTPQSVGSILASLDIIEEDDSLREKLWENINYFKNGLQQLRFNIGNSETAIFPVIIGDSIKVRQLAGYLHENNIYANPVVYPAVSKNLGRIRMSIMANHTFDQFDYVFEVLGKAKKKFDI